VDEDAGPGTGTGSGTGLSTGTGSGTGLSTSTSGGQRASRLGGGHRQLKCKNKLYHPTSWSSRVNKGGENAMLVLGEQESLELKEDFKGSTKEEGDGIIMSMISQGHSHVQIRALFGVGGYRVSRIQKLHTQMQDPDYQAPVPVRATSKHSVSEIDKVRVKDHIKENYDLEEGFACSHRNQMLYFASDTVQWKDIYDHYTESIPTGGRILSRNRWREYIRYYYPQLRLHRSEGDLCNACYRIEISLKDSSITEEERAHLVGMKTTHCGKPN
jgi:hypothetical protein